MINRIISLPAHSFFLFGARQTGKSVLIRERFKDAWEINLLHGENRLDYAKNPGLLRAQAERKLGKENVKTVFIDEVQKVPALLDDVHALMNQYPRARFILTGSSARKLKRGSANLLGGRAVERRLFPFVYHELQGEFDLDRILRLGSLPAIYDKTEEESRDILRSYAGTYLEQEIQAEQIARNLGGFARFLEIAAASCGELVNFTGVGQDARLPTRTVQSYYEILEDTLLCLRLDGWRKSVRKRLTTHPKYYFFDLGITNAINHRLSDKPDPILRGRLFEQFIILETHRLLNYRNAEERLFYWRTNAGAEVDLLIERGGNVLAGVEIKMKNSLRSSDLSGLRSFHQDHPRATHCVVSTANEPYQIEGVMAWPWKIYLDKIRAGDSLAS